MKEVIRVRDQFYILASSSPVDEESLVLKRGETFGVFNRHGDIRPFGFEEHGIYHEGTRFLSRYLLRLEQKSPLLLSSSVKEENDFLLAHLTNPDLTLAGGEFVPKGTLYLRRSIFLLNGSHHERIRITNFGLTPVAFSLALRFDTDYADIFEVRGMQRARRGERLPPETSDREIVLGYRGLDGTVRKTVLFFSHTPEQHGGTEAHFPVRLAPQEEATYTVNLSCVIEGRPVLMLNYDTAFEKLRHDVQERRRDECVIETSNDGFNAWLNRSRADLDMMITKTEFGLYPYAGIPWFSTIFGRDGILTALEMLWFNVEAARGVLGYLAAHQADAVVPERDAEPGKILHEVRQGEMAALGEIPFGRYYGTIDATPLFVILAGEYYDRTGDRGLIETLWPHIERALAWIDEYGDADGDGFVEYARRTDRGLANQGWKDSEDSVFHADGTLAGSPIALCEVQGYVYRARMKACEMAFALGKRKTALLLRRRAEELRERFLDVFWCEDLGVYAIALDGEKKPCRVRSSNAGQCLFSGIASRDHAARIADNLMQDMFFSGFGVRTIAASEPRYNPMSYHNGSVWPHDNALIAAGLSRYGFKEAALKLLVGLFDASSFMDLRRLPELFCGFPRHPGEGPTRYPVACDPQAWAAGASFMLLQSCIGLSIRAPENKVYFHNPVLPPFLRELRIRNLRVGSSVLDILLLRHDRDVGVNVHQKQGTVEVVVTK